MVPPRVAAGLMAAVLMLALSPAAAAPARAPADAASVPVAPVAPVAADGPAGLQPCRLRGVESPSQCGRVRRPLNPQQPAGTQIDIHFAVLPAVARHKKPDPVFFLAGGPGQSAIDLAGQVQRLLGRFASRRDIVLVDLRGTGRSAPLACPGDDNANQPLQAATTTTSLAALQRCRDQLQALPHGDLRHYTTVPAMQDVDAVRQALGVRQLNLVGVSYGTRAALDYLRQFPQAVRRVVLDGVAPPDMALPAAFAADGAAAFQALLDGCQADARCRQQHPRLAAQWQALRASLPRSVTVAHPMTGRDETLLLDLPLLEGLVRAPLYAPVLATALPQALAEAAAGRFTPLLGLALALGGGARGSALAQGLHYAVVCNEDLPRVPLLLPPPPSPPPTSQTPPAAGVAGPAAGAPFGSTVLARYRQACAGWPQAPVPADFYRVPPSPQPVLLLSGARDPATPPRHGQRVALALGAQAQHVVVPHAGHGVLSLACVREMVFRFVDTDEAPAAVDTRCLQQLPSPPPYRGPGLETPP